MSEIIIFSFYTKDDFYTKKARELSLSLDALGLAYYLKPIDIPEGKEWPDICREKIGYIKEFYDENPSKKVFWIDVDCQLNALPNFVKDFSADIIGFQRGFQHPRKIGYHYKQRFWEPCFIGLNRTENTKKFLEDAYQMEQAFKGRATDDYFFEDSWRLNAPYMSFQFIPSVYASIEGRLSKENITPFFFFGSSGNVSKYVDSVVQHKTPWVKKSNCLNIDIKAMVKKILPKPVIYQLKRMYLKHQHIEDSVFKKIAFAHAKSGESTKIQALIQDRGGYEYLTPKQLEIIRVANAFLYYQSSIKHYSVLPAIKLAWWHLPEPGNYGDWLSPYIINKMTGRKIIFVNPQSKFIEEKHYFSIGSIGKFTKNNSMILGTGISEKNADLNPNATYFMVRGPYTRNRVLALGGECPAMYGDPAIVLPKIYSPKNISDAVQKKVLLVRHFTHQALPLTLPETMEEMSIFASHPEEIEEFIDTLHQYSAVVTSAMHCYITCQAYGIPCALITFRDHTKVVHGDGIKYRDYLSGVGLDERDPTEVPLDLTRYDVNAIISNDKIPLETIDAVYDLMVETFNKEK